MYQYHTKLAGLCSNIIRNKGRMMDLNLSGSSCLSSRPNTLGVKLQLRFDKDVGTFLIRNILHSPEFSFFFQFW